MKPYEVLGAIAAIIIAYLLASSLVSGIADIGLFAYAEKAYWLTTPDGALHKLGRAVGNVLWNMRSLDVLAQVIVLISAALGVVALLREEEKGGH